MCCTITFFAVVFRAVFIRALARTGGNPDRRALLIGELEQLLGLLRDSKIEVQQSFKAEAWRPLDWPSL